TAEGTVPVLGGGVSEYRGCCHGQILQAIIRTLTVDVTSELSHRATHTRPESPVKITDVTTNCPLSSLTIAVTKSGLVPSGRVKSFPAHELLSSETVSS